MYEIVPKLWCERQWMIVSFFRIQSHAVGFHACFDMLKVHLKNRLTDKFGALTFCPDIRNLLYKTVTDCNVLLQVTENGESQHRCCNLHQLI